MNASYQTVRSADGSRAFLNQGVLESLAGLDCVVFDCDGTLVDVRDSYDEAILRTVSSLSEGVFGRSLPIESVGRKLILEIRRTGGFNSDWDTTYALALFSALVLGGSPGGRWSSSRDDDDVGEAMKEELQAVVAEFGSEGRLEGWGSVDRFLEASGRESGSVKGMRRYSGYPGNALDSTLSATFDELYYGERLYRRIYGVEPRLRYKEGLIEKERVMVTGRTLDSITAALGRGRIAMATGRPYVAVEHTLRPLLGYFDREASVFIGDGDIHPALARELAKFKKPSGESLLLARQKFGSRVMLYVGDSAEDRLMARNAASALAAGGGGAAASAGETTRKVLFAGVYGGSVDEREQISYFSDEDADLILRDVNQITEILELVKK